VRIIMALPRVPSSPKVHRKISGSLVGLQQHHQQQYTQRKWVARAALTVCLLFVILYLCVYLSALRAALHHAKATKSLPKSAKVFSIKDMPNQGGADADTASTQLRMAQNVKEQQQQPVLAQKPADAKETLILTTKIGDIRIVLRPDLSKESVDYVKQVVETQSCQRCNLYRAEKPGILQGILVSQTVPHATVKGSCPTGYETVKNDCPDWDKTCACHGPVMTRGMVGWAAGQTGPDFFIDDYIKPASWWGTQHTVWGELQDEASFAVLDVVWTLPSHNQGGLTFLDEPLHFDMSLETSS
jgi:cyclophilin family peptidyl-prolyl cis-trans isomerase